MGNNLVLVVAAIATLAFIVWLVVFFSVVRLWVQAILCGVPVSILDIIGMKLRRTHPALIIRAAIALKQRGIDVSVREIERCYLAFGEDVTTPHQLTTLVLEQRDKLSS